MSLASSLPGAPAAGSTSRYFSAWRAAAFAVAGLVLLPLSVVFASLFSPAGDVWQHLVDYVLRELLVNTLWLAVGVGLGTAVLGVSLAWLTALCAFPGRRIFTWALMLPLAMPAYVVAFVAVGLLDFTGPVQTALRGWFGDGVWFPPIRSTGGVIAVMTLALYPYVYLLARNAFLTQGRRTLEAAQSLGHDRVSAFFRVALPMARPWIAGGVMLVLMETLADFGTVAIFNYNTFTTAIYKAWYGLFSLTAAAQLASILVLLVFLLLLIEPWLRSRLRYHAPGKSTARAAPIVLHGAAAWLAFGYAALVLTLAFIVPVLQLLLWASETGAEDLDARYFGFLGHSLFLGALAAILTAAAALVLAYTLRQRPDLWNRLAVRLATLGYALPGAVLAVGIFIPIAWLDQQLIALAQRLFHWEIGLVIEGTLLVMLLAYLVRFFAAAYNPIDSAMQRVGPHIDEAARSFGLGGFAVLRRVHLPILRGGLLTAALLVFVDVMKEMPITLMTRPFGWDTLAVRIFEMTSEGQWERAALPAIAIVVAGLIPILLLSRHAERS